MGAECAKEYFRDVGLEILAKIWRRARAVKLSDNCLEGGDPHLLQLADISLALRIRHLTLLKIGGIHHSIYLSPL